MKRIVVSLSLLAALLVVWWVFPLADGREALQPLTGLVPSLSTTGAGSLPGLGEMQQERHLAAGAGREASLDPNSKGRDEAPTATPAEELVRFSASVHLEHGALPQAGQLSLPGRAPEALSSMDIDGEYQLEVRREQLGDSALEFRFDALGQVSVLFRRTWRGEGSQHLGRLQLQAASEVSGRVIDGNGRPVAHALVCATGMESEASERLRRSHELKGPRRGLHSRLAWLVGPEPVALNPETRSDASGRFTLHGIAGSWTKIWARSERSRWCWSENLAIDPARPVRDVELRLPELEAKDWIRGIVLDPQSKPVAFQDITLRKPGNMGSSQGRSDERGRFRLGVEDGLARDVSARPKVWEWDVALVENVAPGSADVVLQFEASSWLWVRVVDRAGEPITDGSVMGLIPSTDEGRGQIRLNRVISDLWEDGRARLHAPLVDFDLSVSAEGYESRRVGPFPRGTTEVIEVVLEKLRGLQVRVTSGGKPVAGARLGTHIAAREGLEYYPNWKGEGEAFGHDLATTSSSSATTDPLGRAVLSLPRKTSAHWRVTAEVEGLGAGYSAPVTSDDAAAQLALEIVLPRPGSLRGRVELPPGTSDAGWRVLISDGLALVCESEVLDGGHFHFARLHPGPWQVRAMRPEAEFVAAHYLRDSKPRTVDVRIEAGREALLNFAPAPRSEARLRGQLTIVGQDVGAWQGSIRGGRWSFDLDRHGRFDVRGLEPGEWTLWLTSRDPRWSPFSIHETLLLSEGENWWERELSMGTLSITHPTPTPGEALPGFSIGSLQGGITLYREGDPSGQIQPLVLPAGKYRLLPRTWGFGTSSGSRVSAERIVEVIAGQTTRVRLGEE